MHSSDFLYKLHNSRIGQGGHLVRRHAIRGIKQELENVHLLVITLIPMTQAIHSMTKNDAQVIDIVVSRHTYLYPICEMLMNERKSKSQGQILC